MLCVVGFMRGKAGYKGMKSRRPLVTILTILLIGCASNVKPPRYTITGAAAPSDLTMEAVFVDGGYEFQFTKQYDLQKIVIDHDGTFNQFTLYAKTEGRWESIKSVEISAETPSEIALNVKTDTIRIQPKHVKSGQMTSCQFYVRKPQRTFSIPLEKPPFIK